jgi:hypothetical protein
MATSRVFSKGVNAELDYVVDWSSWLGSDTLATSEWVVPTGLTVNTSYFTDTLATVWLSGGELDEMYIITNKITTTNDIPRKDERNLHIYIRAVEDQ